VPGRGLEKGVPTKYEPALKNKNGRNLCSQVMLEATLFPVVKNSALLITLL